VPSTPILKNQIRPFVVAARPVIRSLKPAATKLAAATPHLGTTFAVLNNFVNLLGYNPGSTIHGYLWWLAWVDHNARSLFANQDGNGDFRNLFLQLSCASIAQLAGGASGALEETILNLTPILTDAKLCPTQAKASARDYQAYVAGKLSSRSTTNTIATAGAMVPFLPKLPTH
jgi:phospholipid/cholesterol/gamma-HCH transport system substrate-binding protein